MSLSFKIKAIPKVVNNIDEYPELTKRIIFSVEAYVQNENWEGLAYYMDKLFKINTTNDTKICRYRAVLQIIPEHCYPSYPAKLKEEINRMRFNLNYMIACQTDKY